MEEIINHVRLTLDGTLDPIGAGKSVTASKLRFLTPMATTVLNINRAEILLRRIRRPRPVASTFQFLSYQVESLTASGQNFVSENVV